MDEVSFDIETQATAALTNNGSDQRIYAGWEVLELRRTIARAQEGAAGLELSSAALDAVNESLDAAAHEAAKLSPDRYLVAEHLGKAANILQEAGAFLGAGETVLEALRRAAGLLGPIGVAVIGAL